MGDILKQEIIDKLKAINGVREVSVEIVMEPQWSKEMMSEAARLELGMM
jgi:metal-sulfur cluster biosynthetic enzyme